MQIQMFSYYLISYYDMLVPIKKNVAQLKWMYYSTSWNWAEESKCVWTVRNCRQICGERADSIREVEWLEPEQSCYWQQLGDHETPAAVHRWRLRCSEIKTRQDTNLCASWISSRLLTSPSFEKLKAQVIILFMQSILHALHDYNSSVLCSKEDIKLLLCALNQSHADQSSFSLWSLSYV